MRNRRTGEQVRVERGNQGHLGRFCFVLSADVQRPVTHHAAVHHPGVGAAYIRRLEPQGGGCSREPLEGLDQSLESGGLYGIAREAVQDLVVESSQEQVGSWQSPLPNFPEPARQGLVSLNGLVSDALSQGRVDAPPPGKEQVCPRRVASKQYGVGRLLMMDVRGSWSLLTA